MLRIIGVRSQKGTVPFQEIETDVETFGELKMLTQGIDYSGCQGIILGDETTLQSDKAKLPPYPITIFITPLKVSNGGEDAAKFFGNYSQMTTDQLFDVVKKWKKKVGDSSPTEKVYKDLKAFIKATKEGTPAPATSKASTSTKTTAPKQEVEKKSSKIESNEVMDLGASNDPMIQLHLDAAKKLGWDSKVSVSTSSVATSEPVNEDAIIKAYEERIAKEKLSKIDRIWNAIKKNFQGFIASL